MRESKFTTLLRFKSFFIKIKLSFVSKVLDMIYRVLFSCDIPSTTTIGKGTKFAHWGVGCVVHPNTEIGNQCKIFQKTTIESFNGSPPPSLGDNVYVGTGACIIGNIRIGNNVRIGANAVVITDIPDGSTVLGIPGELLEKENINV